MGPNEDTKEQGHRAKGWAPSMPAHPSIGLDGQFASTS